VVLTWTDGTLDNGEPVDHYEIWIKQDDGTYSTELVSCDGSNAVIAAANTCTVPMTTLRATPFFLDYDDEVIFKVKSGNTLGLSAFSADSPSGAKI
jgi:hypothetical protein